MCYLLFNLSQCLYVTYSLIYLRHLLFNFFQCVICSFNLYQYLYHLLFTLFSVYAVCCVIYLQVCIVYSLIYHKFNIIYSVSPDFCHFCSKMQTFETRNACFNPEISHFFKNPCPHLLPRLFTAFVDVAEVLRGLLRRRKPAT